MIVGNNAVYTRKRDGGVTGAAVHLAQGGSEIDNFYQKIFSPSKSSSFSQRLLSAPQSPRLSETGWFHQKRDPAGREINISHLL